MKENMDEEGRLLGLPCSINEFLRASYGLEIGQRVYEVYDLGEGTGLLEVWEIDEHVLKLEDLEKLGDTVFARREDAVSRIEAMKQSDCDRIFSR